MNKSFRMRMLAGALLLPLCTLTLPHTVRAATPETPAEGTLLVLGDSISAGYGLNRESERFGDLLAADLGLSPNEYHNRAVSGDTSADLLALLPSISDEVQQARAISVTIGGNDLLTPIWNGKIPSGTAIDTFSKHLTQVLSAIRQKNPSAQIILQTVYNPYDGIENSPLTIAATAIAPLLSSLNTAIQAFDGKDNVTVVDTATAFAGKGGELTNALTRYGDFHPNRAGHRLIYQLLLEKLDWRYPIVYETNGGENNTANPSSYRIGDAFILRNPTRSGYVFTGWYRDAACSPETRISGDAIASDTRGGQTFYAGWKLSFAGQLWERFWESITGRVRLQPIVWFAAQLAHSSN